MAEASKFKFRAFISYSHADTRWAKWLHRALEGFRIDKDLVGRETSTGTITKVLRPIFRDRDDFTAGHTLTDQTRAALDASQTLVVICSPAAAKSDYVNEEIRLFKSHYPERPVLPLIIDGKPGDADLECFPLALKFELDTDGQVTNEPTEILAADVRKEGDGKNLGLAKIVAGLLDLSSDDVFRRAERARLRKLLTMSVAVVAILAVISLFGAWALIQSERFTNYLTLAKEFQAFEVADETEGWEEPQHLARDTLVAAEEVVSKIRGFSGAKILWFDSKPVLSEYAKQKFREGMGGIGILIEEETDIDEAKRALREKFDVVIANFGNPEERFAYQLLSEIRKLGLQTPLVIYGAVRNPDFAREARCYGAVARTTEVGTLFSAVIRSIAEDTRPKVSQVMRQCIAEGIKPYDTADWRTWLEEADKRNSRNTPNLNWD